MRTALIFFETRNMDGLADIVMGHYKHLPPGFDILIYCSKSNRRQFEGLNAKITIIDLLTERREYNYFLTDHHFWDIPYDKVLVAQHDSMLLRNGIEEFYKWDYVGAPWKFQKHGGNGGLSLRSVLAMKDISFAWEYKGKAVHGNEDIFFCNHMLKTKYRLAPRKVCEKFSVETIYKLGTLGYHAIDRYLTPQQIDNIKFQYKGRE